jgi:hypothetical protein
LHYPTDRKIIKPMDLGGIIGGDKYIIGGILFKVSKPGLFPDEGPSQKIAGHELVKNYSFSFIFLILFLLRKP